MLRDLKVLGRTLIEEGGYSKTDVFVESSKLEEVKKAICVVFERKNEKITYKDIHIEKCDPSLANKYLYKYGSPRGCDRGPTSKIKKSEPWEATFKERVYYWFTDRKYGCRNPLFSSIREVIDSSETEIKKDFKETFSKLSTKEKQASIVTIKIFEEGKEKFIGDIPEFKDVFIEICTEKWKNLASLPSSKGKGTCCLCNEEKEVLGYAFPFTFYTVDKPGEVYGLQQANSWKQLPICQDCAIFLEVGKNYVDKNLSHQFYGYNYYVIPGSIFEYELGEVIKDIKYFEEKEYKNGLMTEEERISDLFRDKKDIYTLDFLFYEKTGSAIKIHQYAKEVTPSWIRTLMGTREKVETISLFKEKELERIFGENWTGNLKFGSLGKMVYRFFPTTETGTGNYKQFLNIVGALLSRDKIRGETLVNAFLRKIRSYHRKEKGFKETKYALWSLMLLNYINKIGLLEVKREGKQISVDYSSKTIGEGQKKVEHFFKEFDTAFNLPEKKAVFLEGVLTRFLLDVQAQERGAKPFRSKLHDLKIDKRLVKKLLPQILEKFRQYDATYYSWLEETLSEYLLKAEQNEWGISNHKISYYFALGLSLGRIFKRGGKNKNEKEKE